MSDQSGEQGSTGGQVINCPYCGGTVEVVRAENAQMATCTHCGQSFLIPGLSGAMPAVARIPGEATFAVDDRPSTAHRQDEIDGVRIRQIAQMRRAAYRSRSYLLIVAVAAIAGGGQLLWNAVANVRGGQRWTAG